MHEPDDLIEHILYECATFLDKFRDAGPKAHVLDIFDNRIAKMVRVFYSSYLVMYRSSLFL